MAKELGKSFNITISVRDFGEAAETRTITSDGATYKDPEGAPAEKNPSGIPAQNVVYDGTQTLDAMITDMVAALKTEAGIA